MTAVDQSRDDALALWRQLRQRDDFSIGEFQEVGVVSIALFQAGVNNGNLKIRPSRGLLAAQC